jgi:hypothetical protein
MRIRIKTKWNKQEREVSAEEIVGVLAFNAWKIGMTAMLDIENEEFDVDRQMQRVAIISEIQMLLVHSLDRIVYDTVDDNDRATLITIFARKLADHVHDNARDFAGPGDYRTPFIEKLNQRMADYAETKWDAEKNVPGFSMAHEFATHVANELGPRDNKWALDYLQQVLLPEIMQTFNRTLQKTGLLEKVGE